MLSAPQSLKEQVAATPLEPGCYIMRDAEGNIIYIGKAKALRNRLNSYLTGVHDIKTATLMRYVKSIETITVSNEYEALLLENTLIKQHKPKYNIDLKDGKSYPVIRITKEEFPRIFKTRHIIEDGSLYYGPFPSSNAVDKLLEVLKKIYPLRKCKSMRKRSVPCMYYHIEQCCAPCCGKISVEKYAAPIKKIERLLRGKTTPIIIELTKMMHDAARELSFEKAAGFRDAIAAIDELSSANSVVDFDTEGRDYIAFAMEGVLITWTVFSMRGGKLTGRDLYRTKNAAGDNDALETFCMIYYNGSRPPPARIFIQKLEDDFNSDGISKYFSEQFGFIPRIEIPDEKRLINAKRHAAALAMAKQNAAEDVRKRVKERGAGPALDELQKVLNLKRRPERIEGFDIAQLDGKHPVASLVSFYNGVPDKKSYRLFKLKTVIGKVDDFAAMREAVRRRYTRLLREQKELPDLILIDGGIGQVNAGKGVLDELGIFCDIAGLAKREEEIWLPALEETPIAKPICLPKNSEALKVLQSVRDETHRFATGLNQKLRSKDIALGTLESIEGIGAKRAQKLIKKFENLDAISNAEIEDIANTAGISTALAKMLRAAVHLELENRAGVKNTLGQKRV